MNTYIGTIIKIKSTGAMVVEFKPGVQALAYIADAKPFEIDDRDGLSFLYNKSASFAPKVGEEIACDWPNRTGMIRHWAPKQLCRRSANQNKLDAVWSQRKL